MTDHPITPPPELKQQWSGQAPPYCDDRVDREVWLINRAAKAQLFEAFNQLEDN